MRWVADIFMALKDAGQASCQVQKILCDAGPGTDLAVRLTSAFLQRSIIIIRAPNLIVNEQRSDQIRAH